MPRKTDSSESSTINQSKGDHTILDGETAAPIPSNQAGARDIMIFRGAEYWPTPEDVIREVHAQGLSIRIARNNIPEGLVRGLSRIALAHVKAVMTVEKGTKEELKTAFEELGKPDVDAVLAARYEHEPSRWLEMPESKAKRDLFQEFGVKFVPGIFAYTYYTGTSYFLKPGEDEAPADLTAKGVVPVRGVVADTGDLLSIQTPDVEGEIDQEAHDA